MRTVTSLQLLIMSVALGTDLFSVAIPIGMNRLRKQVILRAAVVFALFHIVMILVGYHFGHWIGAFVEVVGSHADWPGAIVQNWAAIFGALILTGLGIHMIIENFADDKEEQVRHPLQGFTLIVIATSVSVDALAAGISMGMMEVDLLLLSTILGFVIFFIALIGLGLGRKVGRYIGHRAEMIGGTLLSLFGLHILWSILI